MKPARARASRAGAADPKKGPALEPLTTESGETKLFARAEALTAMADNARVHDERQLEELEASIERFGQQHPIVINRSGIVIAGSGRLEAMRRVGQRTSKEHGLGIAVWVTISELEDHEARAFAIVDNRLHDLSRFDDDMLRQELARLAEHDEGEELCLPGYSEDELEKLLDENVPAEPHEPGHMATIDSLDVDAAPAPPDVPISKRGDLWVLGSHRLLCGDSCSAVDLRTLLAGQEVHLFNTDPPYNVKVEPRSNNAIAAGLSSFEGTKHHQSLDLARHPTKAKPTGKMRAKDRPLRNDFVAPETFDKMLRSWFGNAARNMIAGGGFYVWGGYANCANYPSALAESGLYFAQAVIWVKEHPVLTRKDFMGNHEWCFYGWKEGAAHRWFGPNNAVDVWRVKKVPPSSMVHLTEKPVELAARAIEYSSQEGENVLDMFGGSGSTLVACERLRRRAHLMEIDPAYCDVIVDRWQKLTGLDARLGADGPSYSEVRAERSRPAKKGSKARASG